MFKYNIDKVRAIISENKQHIERCQTQIENTKVTDLPTETKKRIIDYAKETISTCNDTIINMEYIITNGIEYQYEK